MYYNDPFLHVLFIIIVVVIIFAILRALFFPRRWYRSNTRWVSGQSSALTILEERYAKGEISKEEFDTRRRDLMNP